MSKHPHPDFVSKLQAAINAAPTDSVKELLEAVLSVSPAMTNGGGEPAGGGVHPQGGPTIPPVKPPAQ